MNIRNILYFSTVLTSFIYADLAYSATLTLTKNENFSTDVSYNNNYTGIVSKSKNQTNGPWIINTTANINANNNNHGIIAELEGKLKIVGNGTNTITSKDNNGGNIEGVSIAAINPGAEIYIENINAVFTGSISTGTQTYSSAFSVFNSEASLIDIKGNANGENKLIAGENISKTSSYSIYNLTRGSIKVSNMDIHLNDNKATTGHTNAITNYGETIELRGVSSGKNTLEIKNNFGHEQFVGIGTSKHVVPDSKILIEDMNIHILENTSNNDVTSLYVAESEMSIKGESLGKNDLIIQKNISQGKIKGIQNSKGDISIKDMNIDFSDNSSTNETIGIFNASRGKINITGIESGKQTMKFGDNSSLNGNSIGIVNYQSNFDVSNVDIDLGGHISRGSIAAGIVNEGIMNIKGIVSGKNTLESKSNNAVDEAYGIINEGGANTILEISNMNIDVSENKSSGNNAVGIYNDSSIINIKGITSGKNYIKANNNIGEIQGYGIGNDGEINISNMNIQANGNIGTSSYGIGLYSFNTMNIIGSNNKNSLELKNNKSSGILTNGINSSVNLTNMEVSVLANDFAIIKDSSKMNIDNTTISFEDSSKGFILDDRDSNINIKNTSNIKLNGGEFAVITGTGTHSINVNNSKISGNIDTQAGTSNIILANNSSWNIAKTSNINNLENNKSHINMVSNGYSELITTNYLGDDANIYMRTELGDDLSKTDKIIIDSGTASGNTTLNIKTFSGNGGKTVEGIKVVDARNNANIAAGAFSLKGGRIDGGAEVYELFQGDVSGTDSQSMYLRSNGNLTDTAKTTANEPSIILSIAKVGMNSLMKRMGELRDTNTNDNDGVWARSYAKNMNINDHIMTKMTYYGFEGGYDHKVSIDKNNKLFIGGMTGYINTNKMKTKQTNGGRDGNGDGYTPSIGIYTTWVNSDGWFVDGVIRHFWENMKMVSYSSNSDILKYKLDRQITAFSAEIGKQTKFKIDSTSSIVLEPKTEITYAIAKADKFKINNNSELSYGETKSFVTKLSSMLGYNKKLNNGIIVEPYIQASILQEWSGKTNISYDGRKYNSNLNGFSYELGGGLNVKTTNHTSVYSDLMYEKGSVIESISGNIGLRYTW